MYGSNELVRPGAALVRYACPLKSCRETKVWLVQRPEYRVAPWCMGPLERRHRRAQQMLAEATLPITDSLPWVTLAAIEVEANAR